jgi:FKBP-type peptidyl-prolyl cis-trans isomerase 2
MGKVKNGQTVSVHYVGTLNDGTEFDNSNTRGEPMSFQVGSGQLISGFDTAVQGMSIGESKTIKVSPDDAYGTVDDNAIQTYPSSMFPDNFQFSVGAHVQGSDDSGQPVTARISTFNDENVTLDFNHPLAGKTLNFEIKLIDIE